MSDPGSERKFVSRKGRRQRGGDGDGAGQSIVDVERNAVEQKLIDVKHWVQNNQKSVRIYSLAFAGAFVAMILMLFVNSLFVDSHNTQFYELLDRYETARVAPPAEREEKEKQIKQLSTDAHELCHTFWSTKDSYNACLVEALANLEGKDRDAFATALGRYAGKQGDSGLGSYFLFYAAYAYENAFKLDKAFELYDSLQELYRPLKKEDIGLYHKARVRYLQGKLEAAEALFDQLIKDHAGSRYRKDGQQYLLLIEAARAAQKGQAKPKS